MKVNWDRFFRIMHEGVTMSTKMNWGKAAKVDQVRKNKKYEQAKKCTPAQRAFMRNLGIKHKNNVDRATASLLISERIRQRRAEPKVQKEKTLAELLLIFVETYKRRCANLKFDEVSQMIKSAQFLHNDLLDRSLQETKVREWKYTPSIDNNIEGGTNGEKTSHTDSSL